MAQNPIITELDPPQIQRRTFDIDNDAVRVSVGSAEFVVDGQGISASGTMTDGTSGEVISSVSVEGINNFQLYAVATTVTTGSITVRLDLSPSDPGVAWYHTSTTLTLGGSSLNTVEVSS